MEDERYCHASCCNGETDISKLPPVNVHTIQGYLDRKGYPFGIFKKDIRKAIEKDGVNINDLNDVVLEAYLNYLNTKDDYDPFDMLQDDIETFNAETPKDEVEQYKNYIYSTANVYRKYAYRKDQLLKLLFQRTKVTKKNDYEMAMIVKVRGSKST